jgi:cysteine-rich repeat protein
MRCFSLLLNTLLAFAKVGNFIRTHRLLLLLTFMVGGMVFFQFAQQGSSLKGEILPDMFCPGAIECEGGCTCDPDVSDGGCFRSMAECMLAGNCQMEKLANGTCPSGTFDMGSGCYASAETVCTSGCGEGETGLCGGAGDCGTCSGGTGGATTNYTCMDEACMPDNCILGPGCFSDPGCGIDGCAGGPTVSYYECIAGECTSMDCTLSDPDCYETNTCGGTCGGGDGGTFKCNSGSCAPMTCDIVDADCFGSDACGTGCEQPKWCCNTGAGTSCTQLPSSGETCNDGSSGYGAKAECETATACSSGGSSNNCGGVTATCTNTTVGEGKTCGPTGECCTTGGELGMSGPVCDTGLICETNGTVSGGCVSSGTECGDGTTEGDEECDDGANGDDTDGCNDSCVEIPLPVASSVAVSSAVSSVASSAPASSAPVSSVAVSEAASSVAVSEAASSVAVSEAASNVAISSVAVSSAPVSSVAVSEAASSEAESSVAVSSVAINEAASTTQGSPPICGNGEIDSGEECDGSLRSDSCEPGDACTDQCQCEWGDAVLCGNDPSICCKEGAAQYCCQQIGDNPMNNSTVCWNATETPPPDSCIAVDPAFECSACNTHDDCRNGELCFDGICSLYDYADSWVKTGNPSEFSTAVGHSLVVTETGSTHAFWNVFQEVGPVFSNTNVASGDGENWTEESGVFIGTPSIAEFTHLVFNDLQWMIGGTDYSRAPRRTRDVWNSEDGIVWSKYPNALPLAVDRHASVVFNNKMWVFGGAQGSSDYGDKILVSPTGVSGWTEAGTIPVALSQAEAVVYNNEILLIGGKLQDGSDSEKVWKSSDGVMWVEVGSDVLSGLNFSNRTATVLGNRIVIVGHSIDDTAPVRYSEDGGLTWAPEISPDSFVFGGTDIEALDHTLWLVGGYDEVTDTNASGVHYLATVPRNTCNPTEFENSYFCEEEESSSSSSAVSSADTSIAASESFSEAPPPPPISSAATSVAVSSVPVGGNNGGNGGGSNNRPPTSGGGPERIVCGDGRIQGREACDDGNNRNRDGCSSGCELESARGTPSNSSTPAFQPIPVGRNTSCGNGLVEGGEECDDGNTRNGDGCSDRCAQEPRLLVPADAVCGNGITEDREACDLGSGNSDVNPDTCRTNCQYPTCGDFVFDEGEDCDNGPANSDTKANACRTTCRLPACGDSILDADETCDDGNTESGDGCSTICQEEEETLFAAATVCGDGILAMPEECDDGNRRDVDGCSSTCLLEVGLCGDGIVQSLMGEQCESSLHDSGLPFGCEACQFASFTCGNSVIDAGEECDDGTNNSNAPDALCRPLCHLARCGDGIQDSQEECDDGNRMHNDSCDSSCKKVTKILGVTTQQSSSKPIVTNTQQPTSPKVAPPSPNNPVQTFFPTMPTRQPLPYQLPLAQLQPLIQSQGPIGDTGPAAVAVVASGMAAGFGWMRRKRK